MRTLGYMKVVLLPLMISVTTMDSSTASPIPTVVNPISEESTLFKKEELESTGKFSAEEIEKIMEWKKNDESV